MKKFSFLLLPLFAVSMSLTSVSAQDTVFGVYPYYHYNWYEYMQMGTTHDDAPSCIVDVWDFGPLHYDTTGWSALEFMTYRTITKEIATMMHPDSAIRVIGISYPLADGEFSNAVHGHWYHFKDYHYHIVHYYNNLGVNPEDITVHYNIYDKDMRLIYTQSRAFLDSDTNRYVELGLMPIEDNFSPYDFNHVRWRPGFWPMTDVFFDTVLTLTDTFYVSKTMTYNDDITDIYPSVTVMYELHAYGGTAHRIPWEKRLYRDTLLTGAWHDEEYGWHATTLFPIIQRDCDTCPQVRNVQFFKGSPTQFFLRWNRGVNHHDWQVSLCPQGTAPDDGTIYETVDPITTLITVDPDSQYVAYVRARCRFARDEWGACDFSRSNSLERTASCYIAL